VRGLELATGAVPALPGVLERAAVCGWLSQLIVMDAPPA
jgi:hypothetical protein